MGFRIQPKEVDIPAEDPFKNDCLERKEPAEILARVLESIEGPCVLAVDAPWGAGKTTFLKMLGHHLRRQAFPVVEFNAWTTDYTDDPFVALSEELTDGLRQQPTGPVTEIDKVREAAKEVLRRAVPSAIRLATAGLLDIDPLMEKEAGQVLASYAQKRLSDYLDTKTSLQTFRTSLEELANKLAQTSRGLPLIFVIDELDRCRPSYAVQLLETAKHLFSVDRVVFILAVNRSELAHSIRAVYGGEFDALGYLRRFIDIDFRLPDSDRRPFIESALDKTGIEDYFRNRSTERTLGDNYESIRNLLVGLFIGSDLSLRRVARSIHRLGLVFASLRRDRPSLALAATTALVLRELDRERYERFVSGQAGDREVIEYLLSRNPTPERSQIEHYLEAVIIMAAMELRNPRRDLFGIETSPLLKEYEEAVDTARQSGDFNDTAARASSIVGLVGRIRNSEALGHGGLGFKEAVQRVELLSPSLLGDNAEASDETAGN